MSKQLRELQARKTDLVKEARDLSDGATAQSRDLTDEEATAFDAFRARIETSCSPIEGGAGTCDWAVAGGHGWRLSGIRSISPLNSEEVPDPLPPVASPELRRAAIASRASSATTRA